MVRRRTSEARARWTAIFRFQNQNGLRRRARVRDERGNTELKEYIGNGNSLLIITRNGIPRAGNFNQSGWNNLVPRDG